MNIGSTLYILYPHVAIKELANIHRSDSAGSLLSKDSVKDMLVHAGTLDLFQKSPKNSKLQL